MSILEQAQSTLLAPSSLELNQLDAVWEKLSHSLIDYSDLYFQQCISESWFLEDGIVKEGGFDVDSGVGIRAISGEKTGFAYTDDISLAAIVEAADVARGIAKVGESKSICSHMRGQAIERYGSYDPLLSLSSDRKVKLLTDTDKLARQLDARVKRVTVSLSGSFETILVLASDGTLQADLRPLVHFGVSVVLEENGKRESGNAGGGLRAGYGFLVDSAEVIKDYVSQAIHIASVNLDAAPAPAGTFPVILGPGWPAVLLHEAVGHGLEGDFNRKGTSAFSGKVGERVASSLCTIVDDATITDKRGSLTIDDEGVHGQNTVLIENGVLKGYMQDKLNARLMKTSPTGNGRRESYAHLPLPRMTNTYMLPGAHEPSEIIESVSKGIYAVNFEGGEVDITSGKFVFNAKEAYLVENGKVTTPVKGAMLIGDGPDVLTKISMVGNDLELDPGVGICGKDGQTVPVGVGQPTLKIDELVVGGTKEG